MYKLRTAAVWVVTLVLLATSMAALMGAASPEPTPAATERPPADVTSIIPELEGDQNWLQNSYRAYIKEHATKTKAPASTKLVLNANDLAGAEDGAEIETGSFEGRDDVIQWRKNGKLNFNLTVPVDGLYNIKLDYFPINTTSKPSEITFLLDGEIPYREAERMEFFYLWEDLDVTDPNKPFPEDARGNQMRPQQAEIACWMSQPMRDPEGLYSEFSFFLTAGEHVVSLENVRGELALSAMTFYSSSAPVSYEQYRIQHVNKPNNVPGEYSEILQAEQPTFKTDASLYPTFDRSNYLVQPSSEAALKLNTIGGVNWAKAYQTISWGIQVPEDGWYKIGLKARQNLLLGMFTTRDLTIDGEVPFAEAANIKFQYSGDWYLQTPGGLDTPCLFYLEKGRTYQVALTVNFGEAAETVATLKEAVYMLNAIYRRIIMVMGVTRDPFWDYKLDYQIKGFTGTLVMIRELLQTEVNRLRDLTGSKADSVAGEAQVIILMINQLTSFINDPDSVPDRVSNFKSNIDSLGAWILRLQSQSLEMDYLEITSETQEFTSVKTVWYKTLWYNLKLFWASFFQDYNMFSDDEVKDRKITVWLYGGRDQAQIVKDLIDNQFNAKGLGIGVELKLVQADLITAIVAKKGPDLAMSMDRGVPVNMAMRGALLPLSGREGFDEVAARFMPNAMDPYTYEGQVYAIPVTSDFSVMFYREDIFENLGIQPPETWAQLAEIIPTLQRNNMQMGLPYGGMASSGIFDTLLFQTQGHLEDGTVASGDVYQADFRGTRLGEAPGVAAFQQWTDFYTKYGFSLYFDFYNRFRSGEMPIGITGFGQYNMLSAAAPEIRGMWKMTAVPGTLWPAGSVLRDGTVLEEDTIVRYQSAGGSAAGIVKGCKDEAAAWEFVKWWTSPEAQGAYGIAVENLLGTAARYNPAALEAFEALPWSNAEKEVISDQRQWSVEVPEIPGGYYTARCLDNAFRSVINNGENPRDMLLKYTRMINDEILRKRAEFGLD